MKSGKIEIEIPLHPEYSDEKFVRWMRKSILEDIEVNHLIQTWIDIMEKRKHLESVESDLLQIAEEKIKLPQKLRVAASSDVVVGAILYYPNFDEDSRVWNRVEEVHNPSDLWKGYSAHDGNCYGLEDAFVEIKDD